MPTRGPIQIWSLIELAGLLPCRKPKVVYYESSGRPLRRFNGLQGAAAEKLKTNGRDEALFAFNNNAADVRGIPSTSPAGRVGIS